VLASGDEDARTELDSALGHRAIDANYGPRVLAADRLGATADRRAGADEEIRRVRERSEDPRFDALSKLRRDSACASVS
jgi:hypothetical protein